MTLLFLDTFIELKLVSSLSLDKFLNSLCVETISSISKSSMFSSNPLFSCIVTFCTLIFLYLPHHLFSKIVFSPVLILTGILLLTILRLGANQKYHHKQKETQQKHESIITKEENKATKCGEEKQNSTCPVEPKEIESLEQVHHSEREVDSQKSLESSSSFMEWNVRAPLEIIYEGYEDEEKLDDPNEKEENWNMGNSNYPSLSRYYPESDSDSSSEDEFPVKEYWDSPEEWEEEDREGLIEIALDGSKMMKRDLEFQYEEENLIEIDISPTRYKEFSGEFRCN
ncbi:hypothetical protein MtrunA17_Chr4g0048371 [Medicago truncatula]|uniref:Transmembrane protein, putative n=1 Tax=Medicago truncatula TaxID=3880 RepID=Q2HTY2_MEDTR|nr:conserved hypothetical protein [Medicago truncatula]AES90442.2 transmembrane protein, putative [Medicago truncatula]RHN62522.1 hypothetical protein MtrunA17_Chr4g0048371 [Medicago truncatula]